MQRTSSGSGAFLGVVEVPSPQMRNRREGMFSRPVLRELGFTGAMMTPALERAATDFGAEESFEQAAKRLEEQGVIQGEGAKRWPRAVSRRCCGGA